MAKTSGNGARSVFSRWLRTGQVPSALSPDGLERKFNPWHDTADGRFTFANTGRHYGAGGADTTEGKSRRTPARGSRAPANGDHARSRIATPSTPKTEAPRTGGPVGHAQPSVARGAVGTQSPRMTRSPPRNQPNPEAEFIGGVGRGLYDVGAGTVTGVHTMLTTNPVTTVRNAGHNIAGMIDTAIAAEDTPAHVQVARAVQAVGNASARDIGRATGAVAGNVALAVVPGTALSKVSAVRRLRMAKPRPTYDPPQIGWVKETVTSDKPWKAYNDSATGSRPGRAPTLIRTMPDHSKRPVKFDGIQGDYVIDRKWKIVNAPRSRAQVVRQADVLAQHRLLGTWEVPTPAQKTKGLKLLKRMNVTNIKIRIVKP